MKKGRIFKWIFSVFGNKIADINMCLTRDSTWSLDGLPVQEKDQFSYGSFERSLHFRWYAAFNWYIKKDILHQIDMVHISQMIDL